MSAADKRIDELLDRWMASVELHTSYLELDDAAYAKVQDWPRHQRPTRWIVELARSRLGELRRQVTDHQANGDGAFAESLELMSFLTTLLGSEHVERFIPQAAATPCEPGQETVSPTVEAPRPTIEATVVRPRTTRTPASHAKAAAPRAKEPAARPATRAAQPRAAPAQATGAGADKSPAVQSTAAKASKPPKPDKVATMVIADAARMLSWGRAWPELASLICRLADRPPEQEVWAILRTHRAAIEAKARTIPD